LLIGGEKNAFIGKKDGGEIKGIAAQNISGNATFSLTHMARKEPLRQIKKNCPEALIENFIRIA